MVAPAIIYAGISAASSIYQGNQAAQQNIYNAEAAWNSAMVNAEMSEWWGNYNADNIYNVAQANALNLQGLANFNANQARTMAEYNANVARMTAEYNAKLNERDSTKLLEAAEIDVERLDRNVRQAMGGQRAYFANAGVQVNKEGDTPQQLAIDTATQRDIDAAIIRRSADMEAAKYLDAAAMGRWQGEVDAIGIEYGGEQEAWRAIAQGGMQSAAMMNEATAQANSSRWRGQLDAALGIFHGENEASAYQYQANLAQQSGYINAAMSAGQAYMGYKFMNSNNAPAQPKTNMQGGYAINYNSGASQPRTSQPGTDLLTGFNDKPMVA